MKKNYPKITELSCKKFNISLKYPPFLNKDSDAIHSRQESMKKNILHIRFIMIIIELIASGNSVFRIRHMILIKSNEMVIVE